MSFELVYTSVPRGLTGASGFTTVAATNGIPRLLHQKMESLSGYRHTPNSGGERPVNHSHVMVRIQRSMYHIVSRVADAGIDYSGRTNKIAHHLALADNELSRFPSGPASLFTDHAFWYDEWVGEAETLASHRAPAAHSDMVSDFDTWGSVFGDPGWAGLLGQAAAEGNKPVTVIVPPMEDAMQLLVEALQLVKPAQRWKVGFSTYFSRLAPGTTCHWRFVLDGTSEASKLRTRTPGLLIDPGSAVKHPPDGSAFVEAARAGRPESVHSHGSSTGRRTSARAGSSGARRRPSARRRSGRGESAGPRPVHNPFGVPDEIEEFEEFEEVPQRGRGNGGKPSPIVWAILGLFVAVIGLIVYYGIQQLG